ncbi:MAG TPA: RDD family protein [Flavobacterium sp.]|nr:RDD family protein [Flavobacterium sp.]
MKQTPLRIAGLNDDLYAGFGPRIASLLLDIIFFLPIGILTTWLNGLSKDAFYYTMVPNLLFGLWYYIYLPKKYGGTPGKLLVGIKILKIDGRPIGWDEAVLRHVVLLVLQIFNVVITIMALDLADEDIYLTLSWFEKSAYLTALMPGYFRAYTLVSSVWVWSELIVLLTNPRKRAFHDYMAGTVIIKKRYEAAIVREMYPEEKNNPGPVSA